MAEAVICPFCGFKGDNGYMILLHIEEHHTEDSPFVVNDATSAPPKAASITQKGSSSGSRTPPEENPWVKCTRPGCGEYVLISDIDDHLELHEATAASEEEVHRPSGRQTPASSNGSLPRNAVQVQECQMDMSRRMAAELMTRTETYHLKAQERVRHKSWYAPLGLLHRATVKAPPPSQSQRGRSVLEYFTGTSYHGQSRPPQPPPRRPIREPREPGRLGKKELGPHAYEKAMPADVRRRLLSDAEPYYTNRIGRDGRLYRESIVENETSGLVPILADLCALDRSTVATYFCHPSVRHVVKIRCDGNFCGYWNIQMLLSYIHDQSARATDSRAQPLPNVLQIQDVIEKAWDADVCSYGRIETGGIRGTRKWIGTHEALAFFTQIQIPVEALSLKEDENDTSSQPAVLQLLDHIEAYFISGLETARHHHTSHVTSLPPVYFQRFGHSMTIVGLERKADGSRNLLVFDPSFATAGQMGRLLAKRTASAGSETLLRP